VRRGNERVVQPPAWGKVKLWSVFGGVARHRKYFTFPHSYFPFSAEGLRAKQRSPKRLPVGVHNQVIGTITAESHVEQLCHILFLNVPNRPLRVM
jgi:hypothetical protein